MKKGKVKRGKNEEVNGQGEKRGAPAPHGGFNCKRNCTKVKETATKLHISPDKTHTAYALFNSVDAQEQYSASKRRLRLRAKSRSLEDSGSDCEPKSGLLGTAAPTPGPNLDFSEL